MKFTKKMLNLINNREWFNFAARRLLLGEFSENLNKDSFNEVRKLKLFLELNHLNACAFPEGLCGRFYF